MIGQRAWDTLYGCLARIIEFYVIISFFRFARKEIKIYNEVQAIKYDDEKKKNFLFNFFLSATERFQCLPFTFPPPPSPLNVGISQCPLLPRA